MIKNSFKSQYLLLSASLFRSSENSKESSDNSNKYGGLYVEDKWERVRLIFEQDDRGNNHPAWERSIEMTVLGGVLGGALVGSLECMNEYKKYVGRNDATLYVNASEAQRFLARYALASFCKGMIRGVPIFGAFVGSYVLLAACVQAYRDKKGIIEYSLGGFGVGALARFNYGLRGMFSGGLVGGTLGTLYGIFNWSKFKLLNINEEDYVPLALSAYRQRWYEQKFDASKGENSSS